MHVMEEIAITSALLKIGEHALPDIAALQGKVAEGKMVPAKDVWAVVREVGDGLMAGKLGDLPVIHGHKAAK